MSDITEVDEPIVYDIDYRGGITPQGNLKQRWNEAALQNAVKMWIASYEGEIIGNPDRGGFLMGILGRPMRETDVDDFEDALKKGFRRDFTPYLKIESLVIEPDYAGRKWIVSVSVFSPELKLSTSLKEFIRGG